MKQLITFFAMLALTGIAFFPAAAHADVTNAGNALDDLDVTMVVLDNVGALSAEISKMDGPDHDAGDDHDEDESDREHDFEDAEHGDDFDHDDVLEEDELDDEDDFEDGEDVDMDEFHDDEPLDGEGEGAHDEVID